MDKTTSDAVTVTKNFDVSPELELPDTQAEEKHNPVVVVIVVTGSAVVCGLLAFIKYVLENWR